MRPIVRICSVIASILVVSARLAGAQTTAVGPYYAVPSWDQTLACTASASCPRFVVLSNMNNDAVLDRETGLVWERAPFNGRTNFAGAALTCAARITGDRFGWRLPTLPELQTLTQPSKSNPALPDGHPFANVQFDVAFPFALFDFYWTTTADPHTTFSGFMIAVSFKTGETVSTSVTNNQNFWCVRGGAGSAN
jgi:hypothetical protein